MKKALILTCLTVLILMMTSSVWAAGTIGIDFIPGGSDLVGTWQGNYPDLIGDNQTGKFKSNFITLDGTIEDFTYGIDYGYGTDDFKAGDIFNSNTNYDFNMTEYKFGAQVLNHERVKLAVMISQLQIQLKNSGDQVKQNGTMLGCEANIFISEKVSFNGYLGYSLFGATYEDQGIEYDPAFLTTIKARINYAVAEHVALSLGLRETWCVVNDYKNSSIDGLGRGIGGFSMGVRYSF